VYWVNQVPHYGNRTTSRNESSHAAIKAYLGTSSGDHKHFFDAVCLFWEDQHRDIVEAIGQAKIKPRVAHNILFFQDVIAYVHPYAFDLILKERGKLPLKLTDPLPMPCTCTVQVSLGIPCQHTIRERQNGQGLLQLSDIDRHWYYDRNAAGPLPNSESRRILLNPNPADVKKKGRPKGTKKKLKKRGDGESSTRRDPSLFEHEALELPSSTAPPRLESTNPPPAKRARTLPSRAETSQTLLSSSSVPAATPAISKRNTRSTTKLALLRGVGGPDDPYQPGTERERAYMRSIHPDKLVEADVLGDDEDSDDSDSTDDEERAIDAEITKYVWEEFGPK
jgi:hypothetical protein